MRFWHACSVCSDKSRKSAVHKAMCRECTTVAVHGSCSRLRRGCLGIGHVAGSQYCCGTCDITISVGRIFMFGGSSWGTSVRNSCASCLSMRAPCLIMHTRSVRGMNMSTIGAPAAGISAVLICGWGTTQPGKTSVAVAPPAPPNPEAVAGLMGSFAGGAAASSSLSPAWCTIDG